MELAGLIFRLEEVGTAVDESTVESQSQDLTAELEDADQPMLPDGLVDILGPLSEDMYRDGLRKQPREGAAQDQGSAAQ